MVRRAIRIDNQLKREKGIDFHHGECGASRQGRLAHRPAHNGLYMRIAAWYRRHIGLTRALEGRPKSRLGRLPVRDQSDFRLIGGNRDTLHLQVPKRTRFVEEADQR
jgi:hypothetical protein